MHFRFLAAIIDLSLPVISHSIGSMVYTPSELTDLGNIGVNIGISTVQAYIQCASGLAATILDLLLPVTSNNVHGSVDDRFS